MNLDNSTRLIAEMFADITDIFCDSLDTDGLHMLLNYCMETSSLRHGRVVVESFGTESALEVSHDALSRLNAVQSDFLIEKAGFTLQTEFRLITNEKNVIGEYVFPLRVRGTSLGYIQLFSVNEPPPNKQTLGVLQSIADFVASTIDQTHRIQQAHLLVSQLQGALDSRVVIEQAKGVLAERQKLDFSQAFCEIRSIARREQRPVRSVAADIVAMHHCSVNTHTSAQKLLTDAMNVSS